MPLSGRRQGNPAETTVSQLRGLRVRRAHVAYDAADVTRTADGAPRCRPGERRQDMPIPDPRGNEKKETYISRCMEHITRYEKDKWPDQDQRAAICYSTWDRWQKDHGHPEKAEK